MTWISFSLRASGPLSELNTCFVGLSGWIPKRDEEPSVAACKDAECLAWVQSLYDQLLVKGLTTRTYINFDPCGDKSAAAVYGPNVARLIHVKELYDPTDFFQTAGPLLSAKKAAAV
mmetsp:Transcript_944/g.1454  ORF Transcript_944/g.1454 Transcript_944/m.1454 type:complete len:117 (-) Transcript_944:86-436(-)